MKTLGVALALTLVLWPGCKSSETPRYNVLFIAADDLRAGADIHGRRLQMPNLDRLARMGRPFLRTYAQIPMCSPSRASVMSGRRPETTGLFGNREPVRETFGDAVPLQEHFKASGYFTARVGKIYHSRYEEQFRWDTAEDFALEAKELGARTLESDRAAGKSEPVDGEHVMEFWGPTAGNDADLPDGKTARRAAEILEEHRAEPFFLAVGFISSHFPLVAPAKYFELYDAESMPGPKDVEGDRDDIPHVALRPGANVRVNPGERPSVARAYSACVSYMDAQLGVLMETMDRLDLWKNTIVVFWGDQGFHLGEHGGLFRKGTLFEESTRVPLTIVAPEMEQRGAATERIAELADLYPTLLELSRLPPLDGLEGTSLVPLLRDPARSVKKGAFSVVHRPSGLGRSVRTERYRYSEWPDGSAELYDHWSDPEELFNLAAYPAHAPVVSELKTLLDGGYRKALVSP
jgi:uncharacterized sulfatase